MKFSYHHFRIFLLALALGLATVWFVKGLSIAWSEIHVDLPKARSDNIILVHPINWRYFPSGGGSGPDHGHIELEKEEREKPDELIFRIQNYDDQIGFLPYYPENGDQQKGIIPYFLECSPRKGEKFKVVSGRMFKQLPFNALKPRKHFSFTIKKPDIKGTCILSVGNYTNENDSFDLSAVDTWFIDDHALYRVIFKTNEDAIRR